MGSPGGLRDQINAALPPVVRPFRAASVSGRKAIVSGRQAITNGNTSTQIPLVYQCNGVPGFTAAEYLAQIDTLLLTVTPTPQICVLILGGNDVVNGTDPAVFRSNYDSIIEAALAAIPGLRFLLPSQWVYGEEWLPGPPLSWTGPGLNSRMDLIAEQIKESAAAHNQTFVDIRGPTLIWESQNNTPSPGVESGLLTSADGLHPSDLGKVIMGNNAFVVVTTSPI